MARLCTSFHYEGEDEQSFSWMFSSSLLPLTLTSVQYTIDQNNEQKQINIIFYSHLLLYKIQPTLAVVRAGWRHDVDTAESCLAAQR